MEVSEKKHSVLENGKGYILASVGAETGEIPYTAFTANTSYITANPELIKNFLRAIMKGYNYLVSSNINDIVLFKMCRLSVCVYYQSS